MIAKGAKELALMTALFAVGGGTATTIKDSIRTTLSGEQFEPVDSFGKGAAGGAIPFGLTGKFLVEGLASGRKGPLDVVPAVGVTSQFAQSLVKFLNTGELEHLMKGTTLGRNIFDLATGTNIIAEVQAGTKQFAKQDIRKLSNRSQAQVEAELREVRGQTPLPEGALELPPQRTGDDIDTARLQQATSQEIGVEQAQTQASDIREQLVRREGDRVASYLDSEGNLTGGIGHLLTKVEKTRYPEGTEVPVEVRQEWFARDTATATRAATLQAASLGKPELIPALVAVNFQLGTDWFKEHRKTWKLMKEGKFEEAAVEAADSKWFDQTPVRVRDFQEALRKV